MSFNNDADNAYLEILLKTALNSWDPIKPRRWLARYGGLPGLGIGNGVSAQEYKTWFCCIKGGLWQNPPYFLK